MDMNEYLEMFLEESEEHIRQMGEKMMEFEKSPQNIDIVVIMFRSAHTLKGMAGTMGYEKMQRLTHYIENLMDEIRNETVIPNQNTIDFMFKGIERLEQLLKEIRERQTELSEIEDLISDLEHIEEGAEKRVESENKPTPAPEVEIISEDKVSFLIEINEIDEMMIEAAIESEKSIYKIKFQLNEDCLLTAVRTRMFLTRLVEMAEIIKCVEEEDFDKGIFNGTVHLIVATSLKAEDFENLTNELSEVNKITAIEWTTEEVVEEVQEVLPVKVDETVQEVTPVQMAGNDEIKSVSKEKLQQEETAKSSEVVKNTAIRVSLSKIDNLMAQLEEFIVEKGRLENISSRFKDKELIESVDKLSRSMTEMQNSLLSMRMVPLDKIFNRFPMMVRATSKDLGKQIEFIIEGAETELDRTVVDELSDPLIHLIRNSLDHGIEIPDVREGKGKEAKGTIALKAYHRGNEAVIEISDDGNGIDADKLRKKMIEKGTKTTDEVQMMSEEEVINSIFGSGFSTAETVTNLSGRGVGLDVVKTKIESLGGSVKVETEVGVGSKFVIVLPLSLSIIQTLIVNDCGNIFAVPISSVVETIILKDGYIQELANTKALYYRGQVFKVKRFANLFNNIKDRTVPAYCLLIQTTEGQYGLLVDEIIGQKEIVLKPLEGYLKVAKGVTGATVMGDGNIAFVMDVNYLQKNGGDISEDI